MNMKKNGFTLVELIIAMGVGLVILAAIYAGVNIAQRSSSSLGRKVTTQQDARSVLDLMAMEIRMASFNPSMTQTTWTNTALACSSLATANKGIGIANADQIALGMDLNGDGIIAPSNEYIVYKYNSASNTITRSVDCGADVAILGGTGSATMVRNSDAGANLLQYYDKGGNVPASISDIRRVRITIVADTESDDSLTHQPKRMTYTTDVLVINHVLCP